MCNQYKYTLAAFPRCTKGKENRDFLLALQSLDPILMRMKRMLLETSANI
jgi:hypothetical protein